MAITFFWPMRTRKKEKKTAFELSVHKEDKEGLNKPQMTIFSNSALARGSVKFRGLVWVLVRSSLMAET